MWRADTVNGGTGELYLCDDVTILGEVDVPVMCRCKRTCRKTGMGAPRPNRDGSNHILTTLNLDLLRVSCPVFLCILVLRYSLNIIPCSNYTFGKLTYCIDPIQL